MATKPRKFKEVVVAMDSLLRFFSPSKKGSLYPFTSHKNSVASAKSFRSSAVSGSPLTWIDLSKSENLKLSANNYLMKASEFFNCSFVPSK